MMRNDADPPQPAESGCTWTPISLAALQALMAREMDGCAPERRAYFERVSFPPEKWSLPPWGDLGGGFWAVAVDGDRVLWYNDIEEGFNISRFERRGEIPRDEYWCNQTTLCEEIPWLPADDSLRRS
jgi:hypothetical protein